MMKNFLRKTLNNLPEIIFAAGVFLALCAAGSSDLGASVKEVGLPWICSMGLLCLSSYLMTRRFKK